MVALLSDGSSAFILTSNHFTKFNREIWKKVMIFAEAAPHPRSTSLVRRQPPPEPVPRLTIARCDGVVSALDRTLHKVGSILGEQVTQSMPHAETPLFLGKGRRWQGVAVREGQ